MGDADDAEAGGAQDLRKRLCHERFVLHDEDAGVQPGISERWGECEARAQLTGCGAAVKLVKDARKT